MALSLMQLPLSVAVRQAHPLAYPTVRPPHRPVHSSGRNLHVAYACLAFLRFLYALAPSSACPAAFFIITQVTEHDVLLKTSNRACRFTALNRGA